MQRRMAAGRDCGARSRSVLRRCVQPRRDRTRVRRPSYPRRWEVPGRSRTERAVSTCARPAGWWIRSAPKEPHAATRPGAETANPPIR